MQPRYLALAVTIIPLITINASYVYSAILDAVPACLPYIDGCTSISRAARNSDAIFLFRAMMISQAVMLMWYWHLAWQWMNLLETEKRRANMVMQIIGITGACFLILYTDFLGTDGKMYRLMRRYGAMLYFTLTPLAQLILLNQLTRLKKQGLLPFHPRWLSYQTGIFITILILGLWSLFMQYIDQSTFEIENIVEWNFALLLIALFFSSFFMWKDFRIYYDRHPE